MKKKRSDKEKRQLRVKPTTIEKIESDNWGGEPASATQLISKIYALRKKELDTFTPEDLRIVIGQNLSLPILVPMAIKVLRGNILAEGDYYPGDLLRSVLKIDAKFWNQYPELKQEVCTIFDSNENAIISSEAVDDILRRELLHAYKILQLAE